MQKTVPWDWFETQLNNAIRHKTGGRPPYPRIFLFRMHLLQVWFGLSDAETEFQCHDRLSFRKFLGVHLEGRIPDATTLENFRYSATTNVDQESKLIRKVVVDDNRAHDVQHLEAVLIGDEKALYADSGYLGRDELLAERGIEGHICKRRGRGKKGEPTPDLTPAAKAHNQEVSRIRGRVEHPFNCWKGPFAAGRVWYRGLERVTQQVYSLTMGYNLRRLGFLLRAAG